MNQNLKGIASSTTIYDKVWIIAKMSRYTPSCQQIIKNISKDPNYKQNKWLKNNYIFRKKKQNSEKLKQNKIEIFPKTKLIFSNKNEMLENDNKNTIRI